jgi:hypothetical protein
MGLRDRIASAIGLGARREAAASAGPAARPAPAKGAAPKSAAAAAAARARVSAGARYTVWQYQAGTGACAACRTLHGRTITQEQMPQRPATCARMDCTARYAVRSDARRSARRTKSDRRDELRFEPAKDDRRARNERRKRNDGDWTDR